MDGLVSKGSFHRSSMSIGTIRKTCPSKIELQSRALEFSCPPLCEGKPCSKYTKDIREWKKCMLKAKESVFWPRISDDICKAVERCGICQSSSRAAKLIGNVSEVPPHTWHTLGADLFYWNRINFIMIGDYFTKFIIIRKQFHKQFHTCLDKGARDGFHRIWMTIHAEK